MKIKNFEAWETRCRTKVAPNGPIFGCALAIQAAHQKKKPTRVLINPVTHPRSLLLPVGRNLTKMPRILFVSGFDRHTRARDLAYEFER